MENFCYWQEDPPTPYYLYNNKICLLKEMEYRLIKESEQVGLTSKINIFCPYLDAEKAEECEQYKLIKEIKWDKS